MTDEKPTPKPRKNAKLWQAYQWWYEMVEMRKRHLLRINSAERGASEVDIIFELDTLNHLNMDGLIEFTLKNMVVEVKSHPVFDWLQNIKGMKQGSLAAQLIAQIDDIQRCPTVASLWRFAGFAVIDGKAEKNAKGEKAHFNGKLKGVCFNIADQFIRQQTPGYIEIYYAEKDRLRALYPQPVCVDCDAPAQAYQKKVKGELVDGWKCPNKGKDHKIMYSDAHIHNRAWRKMIKEFLKDLWIEWRRIDHWPSDNQKANVTPAIENGNERDYVLCEAQLADVSLVAVN